MSGDNVVHMADRRRAVANEIVARETFVASSDFPAGVEVEVVVFADGATIIRQGTSAVGLTPRQAFRVERLLARTRKGAPR